MTRRPSKPPPLADLLIALDPASSVPLYLQLYEQLRELIIVRRIAPDCKLPSTRELARALEVSRNTVMAAFEQLLAEGYLEGRLGSGTYVACTLPDSLLNSRASCRQNNVQRTGPPPISPRGHAYLSVPFSSSLMPSAADEPHAPDRSPLPFRIQDPALDVIPFAAMQKIMARNWQRLRPDMLFYGNPAGYRPLREAIANHLRTTRSVHCDWQQVIVVNGAMQAFDLIGKVLSEPGDPILIEDPCNVGVRGAFLGAGLTLQPVPVDDEGLSIHLALHQAPRPGSSISAPSRWFQLPPTPATISPVSTPSSAASPKPPTYRKRLSSYSPKAPPPGSTWP